MQYYNEISKGYNRLHWEEQKEKALAIKKNLQLQGLLLDIGAGTGKATQLFQEGAECIALDPAREMVKQFPGLKVVGKAEELPFKSNSFDSVISLTALHHADLEKAWAEIERISKGDASIAVSFFKRAKNFPLARALFKGFREIDSGKDLLFVRECACR
jgi:ubiquinone/menaquinone biosynthesis C-methylase UbiE